MMFCKNCGAQMQDGEMFCPECGAKQDQQPAQAYAPDAYGTNPPTGAQPEKADKLAFLKKLPKWAPIVAIALVVAIIVGIFVLPNLGGSSHVSRYNKEKLSFVLYEKGGDLYLAYNKDQSKKRLVKDFDQDSIRYYEKTKRLFVMSDDTLYCFKIGSSKADKIEQVKKISGVSSYSVLNGGKIIYYMKDEKLCWDNFKDGSTIKSNVTSMNFDEESGAKYFMTKNEAKDSDDSTTYNVYTVNNKNEDVEVVKDIDRVRFSYDDSAFAYVKSEELHVVVKGKDSKVASLDIDLKEDRLNIMNVDKDGNVTYTLSRGNEKGVLYNDYLDDAGSYKDTTFSALNATLYCYDKSGKELQKIPYVIDVESEDGMDRDGYVTYRAYTLSEGTVDLNDKKDKSVDEFILEGLDAKVTYGLIIKGTASTIVADIAYEDYKDGSSNPKGIKFSAKGDLLVYTTDFDTEKDSQYGTGSLWKAKISGKKVGKPETLATDAFGISDTCLCSILDNGDVLWYKNYDKDEFTYDVYLNNSKKAIETGVNDVEYFSKNAYVVSTDLSTSDYTITLKYKGKVIANDVRDYVALTAKAIYTVCDWNKKDGSGDLKMFNGSKMLPVDTSVESVFIPINAD